MDASLHVAVAGQNTIQKQLTVVAHNIANMNTVGFRAENVDFKTLISRTPTEDVNFPQMANLYPAMEQGHLEQTNNPYDIALSGDGWFGIATPDGTAYTRDGRFQISPFGELQTLEGYPVLDAGEAPIQLNPNGGPPEIQQDGRIIANGQQVGNIGVFSLTAQDLSARFGNSGFYSSVPGQAIPVGNGSATAINQGFVEASNVNGVKEITNLITLTKMYSSVSTIVGKVDETLTRATREIGGQ